MQPQIGPLIGDDTLVIFPQNGMTWWYPLGLASHCPKPPELPIFELAKPFLAAMRPDQVLGGIIYSANEVVSPGVIKNNSPSHNRLEFAQIGGGGPDKLSAIRQALEGAGIVSPMPGDIRAALWTKLVNNMSGSTIALATRATSDAARNDPALSEIYRRVVREGLSISAAHGYPLGDRMDPDRMLARLIHHKPSLLQDYEAGPADGDCRDRAGADRICACGRDCNADARHARRDRRKLAKDRGLLSLISRGHARDDGASIASFPRSRNPDRLVADSPGRRLER